MGNLFSRTLIFLTSRWVIFFIFICLIAAGMIISAIERRKGKRERQDADADQVVSSYSGMNPMPWHDSDDAEENKGRAEEKKKSKVEEFYTGKNPKLANLGAIIYREEKMMKERAADVAKREGEEKK